MTAKELVLSARAAGCILTLDGERVLYTPPKGWPKAQKDKFLADLRANKPEIVVYLVSELRPARIERQSDLAACGSPACAGCYAVGPNVNLHPPKGCVL
jgi:hypothetical protein